MPATTLDTPIAVQDLVFLAEGDDVVVGRHAAGAYAVLPASAAHVVRRLAGGATPREAARWYAGEYGEEIDIESLIEDLVEIGVLGGAGDPPAAPVRWQRLATAVFSKPTLVVLGLVFAAAVLAAWRQPDLRPRYEHIFFTPYLTVVAVVLAVGQWPFVLLHEAAHALAGRRLGLATRLSVSTRLTYLVFETTMDGLVTVARRQRWVPMLAGMVCDLVVMAALTLLAAALRGPDGGLSPASGVCLALSYGTGLRVCWQFFLYLRTDLYYLLTLVLGTVDLHGEASRLLRERGRRLLRRPVPDRPPPHPADARAARWYVWLMVFGYAATIATLVLAVVPIVIRFLGDLVAHLGGHAGAGTTVDSAAVLALAVGQLALVAVVALRRRSSPRTHH